VARIAVWVKPGAKVNHIEWDPWRRRWALSCRAPPAGGEANRAVIDLVADWLGVAQGSVRLEKAGSSRAKVVNVDGMTDDEARDRLHAVRKRTS
jgi:uncharacterized protein YggU (UPF0235/DUF167 family)